MAKSGTGVKLPAGWEGIWTDYEIVKGRHLTPRTLGNYKETFAQLAAFVGPAVAVEEVTRRQVAAFLDHVAKSSPTKSGSTAQMRHRGLSAVFGVLAKKDEWSESLIPRNPMSGLSLPHANQSLAPILRLDQAKKLIDTCHPKDGNRPSFEDVRDEAIIRFMFDTGARRGELQSMRHDSQSLNLRDGIALVSGKTGPRLLAFGPRTGMAIHRYLKARNRRRGPSKHSPALWLGHKGALTGNGVYQALAERFRKAGLTDVKQRAHVFRHTFSHEWRKAGGSTDDLVALNGWKSPAMALRYGASAANERAREAHRRISPGERL